SSKSQSHSEQSSTSAKGSNVAAGGNLNIVATGAGKDSNINVIGSNITAGNNAKLIADNDINLQAAKSTYEQHSTNSSSSGSIGVGVGTNGFTVSASASKGRGNADGSDVSYSNTHVTAGNQLVIASGGDTNMKGATASGQQVIAGVGGNLNIESLQESSTYNSTQKNVGVGVTIPIGPGAGGVNVSGGKSKIDSNFQSVTEQSGIKAGDGGFAINVQGNTDLKGGVIAGTDKAVQDAKNSFVTGSLTQSDIQNSASYSANSVSVTGGVGTQPAGNQGTGVGFGHDSGDASSTSQSGISGIAGNSDVRTGDKESGIGKIFDQAKVQKDIDAQTQITLAFSQQAPKAVATFAGGQAADLRKQAEQEPDLDKRAALMADASKWDEGGVYRIALHTATGALSGGVAGALGAGATASAAPLLTDLQNNVRDGLINAGVDPATANLTSQAIALGTAAGMGALASGGSVAGTGMGLAVDANNRQLHPDEKTWIKNNAQRYASQKGISYAQAVQELTAQGDRQVQNGSPGAWDQNASAFLSQAHGMLAAEGNSGPGYMFYATPDQKANPNMYAGFGGTNTPSAADLAAAISRDQAIRQGASDATLAAAGAAGALAGAGPLSAGAMDAYAAYKAAAAAYSPGAALGTGMAVGGASYTGGALGSAVFDRFYGTGQPIGAGFDQRFSYLGLGVAMTAGGLTSMYSTAMFGWAGVPNTFKNWATLPGFIIRVNSGVIGKAAGGAAQGAVKSSPNQ
ncbi:hemagglutinin repeat-containing protein, partial [Collimonas silvisoli]|uniref:hemagglutinin repeat-containing protein n=1 Tax=Collimonas silvisoli TaxID=2825884 RepID=UPI001B8B590A